MPAAEVVEVVSSAWRPAMVAGGGEPMVSTWRRSLSATTVLRVVGRGLAPAAVVIEDELPSFSHSSSTGFLSFSVPLVIPAPELLVVAVASQPGGRNGRPLSTPKGIISISHSIGRGLERTARGEKAVMKARSVEDRMMSLASIEVE